MTSQEPVNRFDMLGEKGMLEKLFKNWKGINYIAVFGLGIWCRHYIEQIKDDITVKVIVDNNPALHGSIFHGIPVISFPEYLEKYRSVKILVSVAYREIARQLQDAGLEENVDFCDMNMYVSLWYWFNKGKVHLTRVNTSITTKCSLNCRHCNMFMPFYKEPAHIPYEEICRDFESLFRCVDKVYAVSLLGGEPFLHPQVNEIIRYLGDYYHDRIGELSLITNATIELSEETIKLIKKYGIFIQISDYTNAVPYQKRFDQFIAVLVEHSIPYRVVSFDSWLDFGFPVTPWDLDEKQAKDHFVDCYPQFRGLNDGNFYFCHVCWSAEKAGLFVNDGSDFLRLEEMRGDRRDKAHILEYSLGFTPKGYMELCKKCGGCAGMNKAKVQAGRQMKEFRGIRSQD